MIYVELPLKYQWVPIDIDNDVFVTVFMMIFDVYLDSASKSLMSVLENEDGLYDDLCEGDILHYAEWAKDVYREKEKIKPICIRFKKYINRHKYTIDIVNNVNINNFEFIFKDHSTENINKGIKIWNKILKKWRQLEFDFTNK